MRQAHLVLTLHISLTVPVLLELLHDPFVVFARALAVTSIRLGRDRWRPL